MDTFDMLSDQRTGIVRSCQRQRLPAHLPQEIACVVAGIADTTRFCAWPSDPSATGCAWWDTMAARGAALGEAIERYCGNLVPEGLPRASYRDCVAAGYRACAPDEIGLFSSEQYAQPGFPCVPLGEHLPIRWAPGRDMLDGGEILVPASLVYVTYPRKEGPTGGEPLTNPPITAGIAAGQSRAQAECAALEELIERDSVAVAWMSGAPLQRVEPPPELAPLLCGPEERLNTTLVAFPNPYDLPVLGALVYDRQAGFLTLGTACRPSPYDAMLKAVAEAVQLHMVAATLDDPHSPLMRAAQAPRGPLKPWRADRAYRRSYRADWRDVTDLLCQLQLALDPTMQGLVLDQLKPAVRITLNELSGALERSRELYLDRLCHLGVRPISVDVTTPDIQALGLAVVRVVAPGLCANMPAAFPLLGAQRLRAALRDDPYTRRCPLPYA